MKKLVLTGGTSSLAHYLLPALYKFYDVYTMGRKSCDITWDLLDDTKVSTIPSGTEILVHVAGSFAAGNDIDIINTLKINTLGTLNVCIAARNAGVKYILLVSSIYALATPGKPNYGIYSLSKKHADEIAEWYCHKYGMKLMILKPSQIYDSKGLFKKTQPLLYSFVEKAEQNKNIEIYGTRDALRNYIFVEDVVKAIVQAINNGITGEYCCVNPVDVTLTEIAGAAIKAFDSSSIISFLKSENDIPDNIYTIECKRSIFNEINDRPIDIIEGMKRIACYRRNYKP